MRGSKFPADTHNTIWCSIYMPSFMKNGSVVSEELRWQDFGTDGRTDGRTDRHTDGQTDGVTALLDLLSPSATQVKINFSIQSVFAKICWTLLSLIGKADVNVKVSITAKTMGNVHIVLIRKAYLSNLLKWVKIRIVGLFLWSFYSPIRERLQILALAWHLWPLSSKGSLACYTYCDTGHSFIMVISEDSWHSLILPSV